MRKELAAPSPLVQGIEYKLQQVFLNLFLNARDAMPQGGWLTIVTAARDDGAAVVEVADTGSGIPAEHLSRIYDPFFTTKDIGKGTGLGLSITYGIVQEHGGTITCDSAVGPGHPLQLIAAARRRVRERARGVTPARVTPRGAASRAGGSTMTRTGSILVIDDEEIMREILEALLTREGYQVRLAANAAEGLELARTMSFDAAIVDMMMPGMDGISALDELKKIDDDLPVLMITAFASVENAIVGDEARRVRLHHQAVQERRGAGRAAQRAGAAAAGRREPRAAAEPAGARTTGSARSSAAARACGRCST